MDLFLFTNMEAYLNSVVLGFMQTLLNRYEHIIDHSWAVNFQSIYSCYKSLSESEEPSNHLIGSPWQ